MSYRQGNNGSFAKTDINQAWLSTEFGESYARRIFGDTLVDTLPRYVKGTRTGQLKGTIKWRKVIKGGWLSGYGLVSPGLTYAHGIWEMPYTSEPILKHGYDAQDTDKATAALIEKKSPLI